MVKRTKVITGCIVVALIAVGFFVYLRQENTPDQQGTMPDNAFTEDKPADETPSLPSKDAASWLKYTSPGNEYSVRLPDGWKLEREGKKTTIYDTSNNLAVVKGKKATVTEVETSKEFPTGMFITYLPSDRSDPYAPQGEKQSSSKTQAGLNVDTYTYTETKDHAVIGPPKGTKIYTYVVSADSKAQVIVWYAAPTGKTDHHKVVAQIVPTITLNK